MHREFLGGKGKVRRWLLELGTGTQHREVAVTWEKLVLEKGTALRKLFLPYEV